MGFGYVIKDEREKGLMSLVFSAVASKMANEFDKEIYYWIEKGNKIPEALMIKLGLVPFDVHVWYVFNKSLTNGDFKSHI
jgi:hypothetical protein